MAVPLKATPKIIAEFLAEVQTSLETQKFLNGVISVKQAYHYPDAKRPKIVFSPMAWLKMTSLIAEFTSEVAWYGLVVRDDMTFHVNDILVYPQKVSGATVVTDDEKFGPWIASASPEVRRMRRFHGHSHVNMGVTPSKVDETFQQDTIDLLGNEDYYIFMIWNKSHQFWAKIIDASENVIYELKDIDVSIEGFNDIGTSFINEAKQLAAPEVVTAKSNITSYGDYGYDHGYDKNYGNKWGGDKSDYKCGYGGYGTEVNLSHVSTKKKDKKGNASALEEYNHVKSVADLHISDSTIRAAGVPIDKVEECKKTLMDTVNSGDAFNTYNDLYDLTQILAEDLK
ncbi:MAG TPA: hypothetical protein PLT28_00020 [Saprospiraceae bacterium]|nr:hypothetical protein [Saprospiraceae bacterium]